MRTVEKGSDFFTREVDALVRSGRCRLAIHSAKDLPDPLPEGLFLAALTRGVDPSDSLVLRTPSRLPQGARIATSSLRREERVRELYQKEDMALHFVDLRGTIDERLALLEKGEVEGVVVAEAALIRLGLTTLPRIRLPGPSVPLQGRLALLTRPEDEEMIALCRKIHHG